MLEILKDLSSFLLSFAGSIQMPRLRDFWNVDSESIIVSHDHVHDYTSPSLYSTNFKGKKPLMRFSQRNYVKNTFRNPAVSNLSWGLFFLGDLEIYSIFQEREAIILKSGSKHLLLIKCGWWWWKTKWLISLKTGKNLAKISLLRKSG